MANKNSVADWDVTPINNDNVAGIDISEGCAPSGINNALRAIMGQLKTYYSDMSIEDIDGLQLALDTKLDADSLPAAFSGAPTKATPVDADSVLITDSAASGALKRTLWSNIKSTLKTYFDGLYAAASHAHAAATTGVAGFMSAVDKIKLDGIAAGAQVNPGAATAAAAGLMAAADKSKLDGIAAGAQVNVTPALVTTTANGLMAAADKVKLNGIAAGATANATDAVNRARANHTGTQDINSTTTGTLSVARGGTGTTSAPWLARATVAALPVGAWGHMFVNDGVLAGAISAGSNLRLATFSLSGGTTGGGPVYQAGSWQNVSGTNLTATGTTVGAFVRVS